MSRALPRRRDASGKAIVLVYHRVGVLDHDPWRHAVSPARFAEHLDVVRSAWRPVPLSSLAAAVKRGRVIDRSVAVTFDDGYADVLREAAPLLERYRIPATVFLASECIGRGRFWWDELRSILLEPGDLPARLQLEVGREGGVWELGRWTAYSPHDADAHRSWRSPDPPPTTRHALYVSLHRVFQSLTEAERERTLDELRSWAGREGVRGDERGGVVNVEEARQLALSPWFEIGAHTMTHALLPGLEPAARDREIAGSRSALEGLLGAPVEGFAYPYGQHDRLTRASVRRAGFAFACAVEPRPVTASSSRWALPRVRPPDYGEELDRLLASVVATGSASRPKR